MNGDERDRGLKIEDGGLKMKNHRNLILIPLLVFVLNCQKPTGPIDEIPYILWDRSSGNELENEAYSVCETLDGAYVMVGYVSYGHSSQKVYALKFTNYGKFLWEREYGGDGMHKGHSVQGTEDGGVIIAGSTTPFGPGGYSIYLIKLNENGDTLWTRVFGGEWDDIGLDVLQTDDSGYIIVGFSSGDGIYIVKTDEFGILEWERTYGHERGIAVCEASDRGYVVVGQTIDSNGHSAIIMMKIEESGIIVWEKAYNKGFISFPQDIQKTTDGGYFIAGEVLPSENDPNDMLIIRTDDNGDTLWTKTYGDSSSMEVANTVCETFDGGFMIGGFTESSDGINSYFVRADEFGNSLWAKRFDTGECWSIIRAIPCFYVYVGWGRGGNSIDAYIAKFGE